MSSDSFAKYSLNERCRVSEERVQDFLDRGFMSQGKCHVPGYASVILPQTDSSVHSSIACTYDTSVPILSATVSYNLEGSLGYRFCKSARKLSSLPYALPTE